MESEFSTPVTRQMNILKSEEIRVKLLSDNLFYEIDSGLDNFIW